MDVAHRLYTAAVLVARREDAHVHALTGDGVFSVPELAYAYLVGKEFAQRWAYETGRRVGWVRERSLGAGPTDLVIEIPDGPVVAVEFKVRSTVDAYRADLRKLIGAEVDGHPVDLRMLIALVDALDGSDDPRIVSIGDAEGMPHVHPTVPRFTAFPTQTDRYAGDVRCVVAAWIVS